MPAHCRESSIYESRQQKERWDLLSRQPAQRAAPSSGDVCHFLSRLVREAKVRQRSVGPVRVSRSSKRDGNCCGQQATRSSCAGERAGSFLK